MGRGGAGFGACCIVLRCGGGVILSCRDRIPYCSQERSISLLLPSHYYSVPSCNGYRYVIPYICILLN